MRQDIGSGSYRYRRMGGRLESFGLALLDAWAVGRPVIACHESAPGSIVAAGQDGLTPIEGRANELALTVPAGESRTIRFE